MSLLLLILSSNLTGMWMRLDPSLAQKMGRTASMLGMSALDCSSRIISCCLAETPTNTQLFCEAAPQKAQQHGCRARGSWLNCVIHNKPLQSPGTRWMSATRFCNMCIYIVRSAPRKGWQDRDARATVGMNRGRRDTRRVVLGAWSMEWVHADGTVGLLV